LHLPATFRTFQRVDFPNLFETFAPGLGWNLLLLLTNVEFVCFRGCGGNAVRIQPRNSIIIRVNRFIDSGQFLESRIVQHLTKYIMQWPINIIPTRKEEGQ
ncbi:MAG: hypothetical protein R3194_14500, partial [Limnobacter sp.]|nr:hypothetical protein [Limnobacter sp.]